MKRNKLKMEIKPTGNVLEIYLSSEIMPDEVTWFGETIESDTSAKAVKQQIKDHPECSRIKLIINSFGGDVREGYGICGELRRFQGQVLCYVDGFANSIASVIAMCADKVYMYKNSIMTIHNMMGGFYGNAAEHRAFADELDTYMVGNRQIYLDHAGDKLDEETLIRLLDAETTLTAQECFDYGLCDEIIDTTSTAAEEAVAAAQQSAARLESAAKQMAATRQAFRQAFMQKSEEKKPEEGAQQKKALTSVFEEAFLSAINF